MNNRFIYEYESGLRSSENKAVPFKISHLRLSLGNNQLPLFLRRSYENTAEFCVYHSLDSYLTRSRVGYFEELHVYWDD